MLFKYIVGNQGPVAQSLVLKIGEEVLTPIHTFLYVYVVVKC